MAKKIAFVLGNGTSRAEIDHTKLKKYGTIYGCNALYRTFEPDHLVAVDARMIQEIAKAQYQLTHTVWTNENKSYKDIKKLNYMKPSKGWSSGPTALWLASLHEYKRIYILGFDYIGLNRGETINNVYADTPNYKRSQDKATYYGNWTKQTRKTILAHPKIKYVRVVKEPGFIPKDLVNISNLKHINIDRFKKSFPDLMEKI